MRIAVFGAGGIGGYLGAKLAQAGEEVVVIARGAHLSAIRKNGLHVSCSDGDMRLTPSIATDCPEDVGIVDVVLLGVKAWDIQAATEAIRPMIGADTGVLTLQNGVEAPAEVAKILGGEHVIVGIAMDRCLKVAPGRIEHVNSVHPNLTLGEIENLPSKRVQDLRAALEKVNLTVNTPANIQAWMWGKLVGVTSLGGVGALVRVPIGVWRQLPQVVDMVEHAAEEVVAVALARDVQPPNGIVDLVKNAIYTSAPEYMASLHKDIVDGIPSELEYWNGAVVRLGRDVDVPTPINDIIYNSLLPQEMEARGRISSTPEISGNNPS